MAAKRWLAGLVLGGVLLAAQTTLAVQPDEILADSALEQRARNLSKELRCMVCQNQSIDDSDAPLARDLRILVRERLKAGDSDEKVLDFLTKRYGEFVLLKPRFSERTAVLWLAPIGILLIGGIAIVFSMRRRHGASTPPDALTPEEMRRAKELAGR
jgi:cytochrome c-type biogenesis protein CcmH